MPRGPGRGEMLCVILCPKMYGVESYVVSLWFLQCNARPYVCGLIQQLYICVPHLPKPRVPRVFCNSADL